MVNLYRDGLQPMRVTLDLDRHYSSLAHALAANLPFTSGVTIERAAAAIARGDVVNQNGVPYAEDQNIAQLPTHLYVYRAVPDLELAASIPELEVVWEADDALIINKPHGLASMPNGQYVARSAVVQARRQLANEQIICAHRLDRLTGGLLLIVKNPLLRGAYQTAFAKRRVRKTYQALCAAGTKTQLPDPGDHYLVSYMGKNPNSLTCWSSPLEWAAVAPAVPRVLNRRERRAKQQMQNALAPGKTADTGETNGLMQKNASLAVTRLRVLDTWLAEGERWVRWEIEPLTGRMHQLRVHLFMAGWPVQGDPLYPQVKSRETHLNLPSYGCKGAGEALAAPGIHLCATSLYVQPGGGLTDIRVQI